VHSGLQVKIIRRVLLSDKHPVEKMDKIWEHNRFRMELPYLDSVIANSMCIIDLSKDTYECNGDHFTIGIALLIDQFSLLENKIVVGNDV
jgi:hypothetical protein